ncbi:MAG TPA: response regulator transcription factor [Cellvibrio sp.]|nr:response regulator transcription factor [Cellvibrio sp.]
MHILIVEDEKKVADFLVRGLRAEGYFIDWIADGSEALPALIEQKPDLVILDRMLPRMDGLQICKLIRSQQLPLRVLMLSALAEVSDRVDGLRAGADDYLVKPFAFEELLARIEALSKRNPFASPERRLVVGTLELNLETMQVKREEKLLSLTAKELAVLELLMSSPQKVFSRERILATVWGINEDPLTNVVDVYIRRLRKKVDSPFAQDYIKTLRGIGYCLSDES